MEWPVLPWHKVQKNRNSFYDENANIVKFMTLIWKQAGMKRCQA